MTKTIKPDRISLLKELDPDNSHETELAGLRQGILNNLHNWLETAREMDHSLIARHVTSDRFVIHTSSQNRQFIPEACSRILLMPRRKYLNHNGVISLHAYLPDDILGQDAEEIGTRAYLRKRGPKEEVTRYLLTVSQLAAYDSSEQLNIKISEDQKLNFTVPDSLAFTPEKELLTAKLIHNIVDKEIPDSYFLKTQNIRI